MTAAENANGHKLRLARVHPASPIVTVAVPTEPLSSTPQALHRRSMVVMQGSLMCKTNGWKSFQRKATGTLRLLG